MYHTLNIKPDQTCFTRFILKLTFSGWSKVQALIIVSQGMLTVTDFKEEAPEGVQGIN